MNAFKNKCPHCTFCANNKAVLKVHLENLHENQRIQPTIAVEKMDSNILNPKISDTQEQQKCKCHICEEEFLNPNGLELHFTEHHQETLNEIGINYQCDLCENSYVLSAELENHLKEVHEHWESHEGFIECNFCGKSFTHSGNLKKHIKTLHE